MNKNPHNLDPFRDLFFLKDFNLDLLFNYLSMGVMMGGGFLINVIISIKFGIATLGAFNQVLVLLYILSQFSVMGLQFSALKHVSEWITDKRTTQKAVWTSLGLTLVFGLVASGILFLSSPFIGSITNSRLVGTILSYASWSIVFLSLNKVLLRTLNGLSYMRLFALCQALRPVIMIVGILMALHMNAPSCLLGLILVFSEMILCAIMVAFVLKALPPQKDWFDLSWIKKHMAFGIRVFLGGLIVETNMRVDILMLGLLASDKTVGYYSFAAIIAEGFVQLLAVVRNKVSPLLTPLLKDKNHDALYSLIHQIQKYIYPASAVLAAVIIASFKPVMWWIFHDPKFHQTWYVLIILLGGIVMASGYIPFMFLLLLANKPAKNTIVFLCALIPNIIFNLLLIPIWGIYGAAVATTLAVLTLIVALKFFAKKELDVIL